MTDAQKTPWQKRARKKRDDLYTDKHDAVVRAAASLFRERGFDAASLNDLASILNITKPTIYYYAKSKDNLLFTILRQAQDQILGHMRAAEALDVPASEKLHRLMIDYALVMISDQGACLARTSSSVFEPASRKEVEKRNREAEKIIYRIMEEGAQDGSLTIQDPVVANHALFGSLNWMAYWTKSGGRIPPGDLAEIHVNTLLDGVRTPAGRARATLLAKKSGSASKRR